MPLSSLGKIPDFVALILVKFCSKRSEIAFNMDSSVNYVISESPWSLTEHGRKAEIKLKSNVYDLEAWSILIREAQVGFGLLR